MWNAGQTFLSFDVETTGVDPTTARIVTACVLEVSDAGKTLRGSWLVNPGVEIPEGAAAIHGVTTERAVAEGVAPLAAVEAISELLKGQRLIIMNAPYDLTVLASERARLGLAPLELGPVLDPLVIDRGCDPYRRGKRKLSDLAAFYGVKAGAAHDSAGDALTAARVVWAQLKKWPALQRLSLTEMQAWQAHAHAGWAANYEEYLAKQGKPQRISRAWPMEDR